MLNFKEIPVANKGGGQQDQFEQFAADFLEAVGFRIEQRPGRGADQGKDMIVSETRKGAGGETKITWLVSCKHHAHSGRSVGESDELNILERVRQHKCDGFLGVYSQTLSSTLISRLEALENEIKVLFYDNSQIEKFLLTSAMKNRILLTYFPLSYEKYKEFIASEEKLAQSDATTPNQADLFNTVLTAVVTLEVDKIVYEYAEKWDWTVRQELLGQLYRFSKHANEKIAEEIFSFLNHVSTETRTGFPENVAGQVESLVMNFFPSAHYDDSQIGKFIRNGKICNDTGFNIAYDAFIYTDNFSIAECGLSILKCVYYQAKLVQKAHQELTGQPEPQVRDNVQELLDDVNEQYERLENTLRRPERNDLELAKKLTAIYRADLERPRLDYPDIPDDLFERILNDRDKGMRKSK